MNSVEGACQSGSGGAVHRKRSRRRGAALYAAIFEATLAELTAVGYVELTIEHVAQRAGASKASLYRRWSCRAELVADAVHHTLPSLGEPPDTGSVREDLLACLRAVATLLNGLSGEAIRGLVAETLRNPELMEVVRIRFIEPNVGLFLDALRRGAARGEVRGAALTPRIAAVGPDLLRQYFLAHPPPIPDQVMIEIVDDVIMALIRS